MTLLIDRMEVLKPRSAVVTRRITIIDLQLAVGTVASKVMDRLGTFLSNSVAKKK